MPHPTVIPSASEESRTGILFSSPHSSINSRQRRARFHRRRKLAVRHHEIRMALELYPARDTYRQKHEDNQDEDRGIDHGEFLLSVISGPSPDL